jgi:hypothetical protein
MTVKFLLNYSSCPLQILGSLGFLMGGVGFALGCYLTWVKLGLGLHRTPTASTPSEPAHARRVAAREPRTNGW